MLGRAAWFFIAYLSVTECRKEYQLLQLIHVGKGRFLVSVCADRIAA
jgi:hypothetical protein